MPIQAIPYTLLLGILFGTTLLASRFSIDQYEPSTYIALRLSAASLGYLIVSRFPSQRRKWPADGSLWWHAAVIGIFGTAIPMNCIVASLNYQSSGITSILTTVGPAMTVAMAHFFLPEEPLSKRKIAGVVMALSGALLLVLLGETGLPDVSQTSSMGYILVFIAMTCGSASDIYARKFMTELDSIQVTSARVFIAALATLPLSVLFVGFDLSRVNLQGVLALSWAAVAGAFNGMILAFYIVKRFGATASAMTAYVIPIVASIGGYFLFDETITWGMIGGMALIAAGIALVNQWGDQINVTEDFKSLRL